MDLKFGDLCWAKMKGFPPWPGKIVEAPQWKKDRYPNKKIHHYIYFFGSGNYAWIPAANIEPNSDEIIRQASKKKSTSLQKAIVLLKEYMMNSDELEEKYYRQGIVKKCKVVISPLSSKKMRFEESVSLGADDILSCNAVGEPQRLIRNGDNLALKMDNQNNVTGRSSTSYEKKFGFIGRGELEREIVENLMKSNYDVLVFNHACKDISREISGSFLHNVYECDIVFCCIESKDDVQSILKGDDGILQGFANCRSSNKGLVLLTDTNLQMYAEIAASIQATDNRYIVAHFLTFEMKTVDRESLVLCSGDVTLFPYCTEGFASFKNLRYIGPDIELAPKLLTVFGPFLNSFKKSYFEAQSLAHELKISQQVFNDFFKTILKKSLSSVGCNSREWQLKQENKIIEL